MMGGGRGTLTPTSILPPIAIVGIGTAIINAKSTIPKNNFFILLPPPYIVVLVFFSSHNQQDDASF